MSEIAESVAERRLQLIFDQAPSGILVTDCAANVLEANATFCRMLGYTAEELNGRRVHTFSHPDDLELTESVRESVVSGRDPGRYERRYLRKNGSSVWCAVRLTAMRDREGSVDRIIALVEEIGERKAAQERLAYQAHLLDCVEQAVIATDLAGTIVYLNRYAERLFGWPADEAIGRSVVEVMPSTQSQADAARIMANLAEGEHWSGEFEMRTRDGRVFPAHVTDSPVFDDGGNLIGVVGISFDISEEKASRERLRTSEASLAVAQRIARVGSWEYSLSDGACIWSDEMFRIFGLHPSDGVPDATRLRDLIRPADLERYAALARKAAVERTPFTTELHLTSGRVIESHARVLDGPGGEPAKLLGVARDVTEQKAAEASMRRRLVEQSAVVELGQIALSSRELLTVATLATTLVGQVLDTDAVEVWRTVDGEPLTIATWGRGIGPSLEGAMTVDVPDSGGMAWGHLTIHAREQRPHSVEDAAFLRSIALVLGQCVDRLRFESELRTRELQQSSIAELGQRAVSAMDNATLARACELVRTGLGVEDSSFVQSEGLPDSHAGFVLGTGEPDIAHDYSAETRFDTDRFVRHGIRSGVAVPAISGGKAFGVLTAHTRQLRAFALTDVHFMQALANIIGEAMSRDAAKAERDTAMHELHLLLESTAEGIYTTDARGICTLVNRAACELLGVPSQELIGRRLHEVMHHHHADGRAFDFGDCRLSEVLRNGVTLAIRDEVFWRADGSAMPVEYVASPLIENGSVRGAVVTFTDITEQKRMASQLERATRLSSLGRLAATMAHEFNNVLMAISPFAEILLREDTDSARRADAARHITTAIQRAKRITSDILRFTRPAEPVRGRIDVTQWLEGFSAEARSLMGPHALEIHIRDASLAISGDAAQLHQVLLNLVINGRDAMAVPGTVSVTARSEAAGTRFAFGAVKDPERNVHLAVTDTGSGMSPETVSHLFEPLYTTKRNGTGIGLSVAHQVVTAHEGHIFVETTLGRGTTFHLFIPRDRSSASPAGATAPERSCRARSVLLVEDDFSVASGIAALLDLHGVAVHVVDTGAAVLPALAANMPEAVVLDIGLPDIDGTVVFSAIAARYPDLPVIFSSGHGDAARLDGLERPNVAFLMKPYEIESLLEMLDRVTA
ncbi:MAG TPA: PAS domain S-box protein [Thermoanaerobaculia bacterium]|nr:PAS domain S-box protein [Thermoanaerobaculia bacterium]